MIICTIFNITLQPKLIPYMPIQFLKTGFQKIQKALSRTREYFSSKLRNFFSGPIDVEKLEELEQILYEADLGVVLAGELTEKVRARLRKNSNLNSDELLSGLKEDLLALIPPNQEVALTHSPHVFLIVGVNGNGKTTTCAKLGKHFQNQGLDLIFGAADTFRAAATEQLDLWATRLNIDIVKGQAKSDPSAVAFDTVQAAVARGKKVALIDTAGRLQNKTNLMQELEKIRKSCNKALPGSPHATYLVLDATIGQNAIDQAKIFMQYTPIDGLILTKLDGTAKGGIILSIQQCLKIPVKYIGIGEGMDDLEPFNAQYFINSLFE